MKRLKKQISLLLVVALVVSSLVIGFGTIKVSAIDQATGQLATYHFQVKTAAQDCNGTGTANSLTVTIYYSDGTSAAANAIAGESTPNYFEAGNTDGITLSPQLPAKPINRINFVSSGGDRWKVDWVNFYYSPDSGSSWFKIGTHGAFDEGGANKNFTYPSDYSLNTSSLNKTLTFNANGGSGGKQIYSEQGATLPAGNIPTVTRTGYTFTGWSPAVPSTGPGADTTYTAQWSINTVTITFAGNGGTGGQTYYNLVPGSPMPTPPSVIRTGHTFTGWSPPVPAFVPSVSTTYYAQWSINSYTIYFDEAGGSTVADITQNYGTAVTAPADPTRSGYTFAGWSTAVPSTMPANNTTCVAQWSINAYTITFNGNGGSTPAAITQNYGTAVTEPANPTRTGYTFAGWSPPCPTTMPANNTTCVAQWIIISTVTITFDANGGTGGTIYYNLTPGDPMPYAPSVTRTGYFFTGWTPTPPPIVPSTSETFYAQWTPVTYYATYYSNDGTGRQFSQAISSGYTIANCTWTRTGYTFSGWNTAANGSGSSYAPGSSAPVTGNIALYAQWAANPYTVVFNSNGGSGSMANQAFTYDTAQNLTANAFSKTGNDFNGWNTAANGSGTSYTDSQSVSNLTAAGGGTVTLYAQWSIIYICITFNANGGTGGTSYCGNYGMQIIAPTVTRTGYTFIAWSPTVPATMPTQSMTFTAQWAVNSYTITFDANGGTGGTSQSMAYGSPLTPPTVTRPGYTFVSWSPVVPPTVGIGDKTYVAQWSVNQYTISFDTNGGTAVADITQDYGTTVTEPADPIRTGFTFVGWMPSCPDTMPANNTTCEAQWSIGPVVIIFDPGPGTGGGTFYLQPGEPMPTVFVTRTGYAFAGWSPAPPPIVPSTSQTYYAQWEAYSYTITFDDNGGTGGTSMLVNYGVVPIPPVVTRTGYTLTGWEPSPIVAATGDATYTAQWVSIPPFLDIEYDPPFFIDPPDRFIFGLPEGTTLEEFENMCAGIIDGNGRLEITTLQGEFGTGTKVELIDNANEEVVGSWRIVIFGDVNGDGYARAVDADIINNYENYIVEWDPEAEDYLFFAGDVNGDWFVGAVDADIINNCENYIMWIDQTTGLAYEY